MRSGRRVSVRTRLVLTMLLVILASWICSAGLVLYSVRQEARAIWRELPHPDHLLPTVRQVIRRNPLVARTWAVVRDHGQAVLLLPLPFGRGLVLARLLIALGLALLAGAWLGRRFTRPLSALAQGAQAFHDGDFGHRIPLEGDDEFARVAASMNEMAARVAGQIARLEDDAQRRQQVLADVAHELRSPVATLRAMADALQDGVAEQPERRHRAVQAIAESADRLQRLVGDLLDLARLDLRELPLHRHQIDLCALATARLDAHAVAAADARVTLHPLQGSPVQVHADPDRLAQVLDNLLDNAVTYAGSGAEVRVTVTEGDPVVMTVADTGRGIPARHLPYVFDPFYRADAARTPDGGHSGLGLRIARALVEAHGGTLTLESAEGNGTRVVFTLPGSVLAGDGA